MDHNPVFKDTYCKTQRYPYNATTLDFLYEKMALFLLQYFQEVFHNRGKSIPNPNKKTTDIQKKTSKKNSTNKTSTKKTPAKAPTKKTSTKGKKKHPKIYQLATLKEEIDLRYLPTAYSTSHPPHPELCDCCGLPLSDDNRENKLTKEDLDDDENDIEEGTDEVSEEIEESLDTSSRLAAEIYKIEQWCKENRDQNKDSLDRCELIQQDSFEILLEEVITHSKIMAEGPESIQYKNHIKVDYLDLEDFIEQET
ncbi:hypothetical protein C2G38_2187280 [Gigaspora rosea]|uniref:Uncharacterized protein n=1 Tax=Gigaspora rosea TaxID=44941 RepID=A0A397VBR2_9GLOM|nr:hypothetical protein C2G38_2187280 [Gigaspora rosea]